MTDPNVSTSEQQPGPAGDERPAAGATVQVPQGDTSSDSIDGAELLRILEGDQHRLPDPDATAITPRVRRMPEGIEVLEQRVGLATGQWLLNVRCQCGRRWYEAEELQWASCPGCGLLVRVTVEAARS